MGNLTLRTWHAPMLYDGPPLGWGMVDGPRRGSWRLMVWFRQRVICLARD